MGRWAKYPEQKANEIRKLWADTKGVTLTEFADQIECSVPTTKDLICRTGAYAYISSSSRSLFICGYVPSDLRTYLENSYINDQDKEWEHMSDEDQLILRRLRMFFSKESEDKKKNRDQLKMTLVALIDYYDIDSVALAQLFDLSISTLAVYTSEGRKLIRAGTDDPFVLRAKTRSSI